jgi:hypothetical protein
MKNQQRLTTMACAATLVALSLAGCGKGSDSVTVEGDVPVAYVKRSTALSQNTTSPRASRRVRATCPTPRRRTTARRSCSR